MDLLNAEKEANFQSDELRELRPTEREPLSIGSKFEFQIHSKAIPFGTKN